MDYSSAGGTVGGLIGGPIGAGVGSIAGGLINLSVAGKQKRDGRNLINAKMPEYQIPTEVTQAANEGLPSEQYRQAMQNIQRQQMQSLASAQTRRGGLSSIGGIQMLSNDAMGKLDVANAQARQQNQFKLAGYKDKQWQTNIKDPYTRNYNYGMQLLGAGNANTIGGLDKVGAGLGYLAGGGAFSKKGGGTASNYQQGDYYGGGSGYSNYG